METLIQIIFLLSSCTTIVLLFFNFMDINFQKKQDGNYHLYSFILILINTFINTFSSVYLNYTWSVFFYYVLVIFLYKGKNIYIVTFLLFVIELILEYILFFSLEIVYHFFLLSTEGLYYIGSLITSIALILIYKPIWILLTRKKISTSHKQNLIEYIILLISFFEVLTLSLFISKDLPMRILFVLILVCVSNLLLDIYMVFILDKKNTNIQLKHELAMMQMQQELNENYYKSKFEQYDKQMKLLHDMKKHILTLQSLYQAGEIEKAQTYTKEIFDYTNTDSVCIGNKVLKILVTQFIDECNAAKIIFTYKVDPRITLDNLTDMEIITVYSNLFSNALTAASKVSDSKIELNMFIHQAMVITQLKNPYCENLIIKDGKFMSTKPNHRAYGLRNVIDVIEKHDGLFNISTDNNEFFVQICLELGGLLDEE